MKLTVGQPAPDFRLFDTTKNKVSLSDFKDSNVLLLFFPMAFSSVCTKELCSVRDNIAIYQNVNANVLGISVDSLYSLGKFKEDQRLNFPLLSDFNKEVSYLYGCLYETWNYDMRGVSKRSAFIIDKAGIIRYTEVLENPGNIPNFEAIITILSSLA
jgi:peroxiredoxin